MSKLIPRVGIMLLSYEAERETAKLIEPSYKMLADALRERDVDVITPESAVFSEDGAKQQAQRFAGENVDLFLLMVGTWTNANYAIAALQRLENVPFAIYAYNDLGPGMRSKLESPTFGFTGAVEIKNSIDQMGYRDRYTFIVGSPDDPSMVSQIAKIAQGAAVRSRLRNSTIGLIGYYTMGMYSATFDAISLKERLGVSIEHIGENVLIDEIERSNGKEAKRIGDRVMQSCTVVQPDRTDVEEFAQNGKMYLAYKRLIERYRLDAVNTKCDPELGVHFGRCACLAHSLLVDEGVMCACEGDIHQTLSMMVLHYLSGRPVMFLDVVGATGENNALQFISCGFTPVSIARNAKDVKLYPQIDMKGRGVTQSYALPEGERVTLYRIDGRYPRGDYSGHVISGVSSECANIIEQWPAAEVVLESENSWEHFVQNCTADHFALVIGDYREELLLFNRMMNFETILTA
jgi:L-fucose isomerase-like protein